MPKTTRLIIDRTIKPATPWNVVLAKLQKLEATIGDDRRPSLDARWRFGRELVSRRIEDQGQQVIPPDLMALTMAHCQVSETEITHRVQFALRYPTKDLLRHGVTQYPSWHHVTGAASDHAALGNTRDTNQGEHSMPPRTAKDAADGPRPRAHELPTQIHVGERRTVAPRPLDTLVLDEKLWPRLWLDEDRVEHFVHLLAQGVELPPIKAAKNSLVVLGGWHTLHACQRAGRGEYPVEIVDVPEEDHLLFAYRDDMEAALSYSDTDVASVACRLYEQRDAAANGDGVNVAEIARDLQRSPRSVARWVHDLVEKSAERKARTRAARELAAQALLGIGVSKRKAARLLGVSEGQVRSDCQVAVTTHLGDEATVAAACALVEGAPGLRAHEAGQALAWIAAQCDAATTAPRGDTDAEGGAAIEDVDDPEAHVDEGDDDDVFDPPLPEDGARGIVVQALSAAGVSTSRIANRLLTSEQQVIRARNMSLAVHLAHLSTVEEAAMEVSCHVTEEQEALAQAWIVEHLAARPALHRAYGLRDFLPKLAHAARALDKLPFEVLELEAGTTEREHEIRASIDQIEAVVARLVAWRRREA